MAEIILLDSSPRVFLAFFFSFKAAALLQPMDEYLWRFSKPAAALTGVTEHAGTWTACCYCSGSGRRHRFIICLSAIAATPVWLMRRVNKRASFCCSALMKGSTKGQVWRGSGTCRQSAAVSHLSLIVCLCWVSLQGAFWRKEEKQRNGELKGKGQGHPHTQRHFPQHSLKDAADFCEMIRWYSYANPNLWDEVKFALITDTK